ncbi:MAG: helix-turn-helix domain-containing protein [Cytophagaceae bacterium]|nr:helix-turn-helix domain-containing protein [Cytophagaceae bacterium]MDW8457427.1 helix-turn-helix transcriptional regulator [Cytophagaceae bacterium]
MNIGEKIKRIRELKNYTQEYMAEQLQISQSQYSRLESGESDLLYSRLEQIAKVLEMTISDIDNFDENISFISKNKIKRREVNHFQAKNNLNLTIKEQVLNEEMKKLYEDIITQLKTENAYLKDLVKSLIKE